MVYDVASVMSRRLDSICRSCGKPAKKRGLCATHYNRLWREGLIINELKMYGERAKHPLYRRWVTSKQFEMVPEWLDFTVFVADIGEQPGPSYRLRKKMPGEPFGPGNFRWVAVRTDEEKRAVQQLGRTRRYYGKKISGEPVWTDKMRNSHYQRRFGISLSDYNEMLSQQNGKCAICLKEDNRRLAVDHCHSTRKVRGLLCSSCNISIGRMDHDLGQLKRAAAYLQRAIA